MKQTNEDVPNMVQLNKILSASKYSYSKKQVKETVYTKRWYKKQYVINKKE